MPIIKNNAAGPRVFNLAVGAKNVIHQRVLQPGEAADLDLAVPIEKDRVLSAMLKSREIEVVQSVEPAALDDEGEVLKAEAEAAAAVAKATEMRARLQTLALDGERRTPPRQLASDGGEQQVPTVDGNGGALTPVQEEKGRVEQPKATADAKVAARAAGVEPPAEAKPAAKPADKV